MAWLCFLFLLCFLTTESMWPTASFPAPCFPYHEGLYPFQLLSPSKNSLPPLNCLVFSHNNKKYLILMRNTSKMFHPAPQLCYHPNCSANADTQHPVETTYSEVDCGFFCHHDYNGLGCVTLTGSLEACNSYCWHMTRCSKAERDKGTTWVSGTYGKHQWLCLHRPSIPFYPPAGRSACTWSSVEAV